MTQEDAALAQLEIGRLETEKAEVVRQERYAAEDAETAHIRAEEDRRQAEGVAHREATKAALEAVIAERNDTPEKRAAEQIAEMGAKIAHLEALMSAPAATPAEMPPAT